MCHPCHWQPPQRGPAPSPLSDLPGGTDTYCYSIRGGTVKQTGINCCPPQKKSHWESLSKPNTTSGAPDAVLRQPLTSSCCSYKINSIVLWFVIFLGMKIILAQIYRDHNAISKQTLCLLARSFVNTTKRAELCTQFAGTHVEVTAIAWSTPSIFKPGSLQAAVKPSRPAAPRVARGIFSICTTRRPVCQPAAPGNPAALLRALPAGAPMGICTRHSARASPGLPQCMGAILSFHGRKKKRGVVMVVERKHDKSFGQRIFFRIQPTIFMVPKLLAPNHQLLSYSSILHQSTEKNQRPLCIVGEVTLCLRESNFSCL